MPNVYSPYKAAYHFDRISALRKRELVYPTQIQIDLTNRCNHKCIYCFSKFTLGHNTENDFVDTSVVFNLLDDAKKLGVKCFHYTGGGEPFLHRDIYAVLEKTIANGLEYGMVTNGTLIDFDRVDLLEKMSWIRISIDASDSIMYYRLRKVDEFDKTIKIAKNFVEKCPDTVVGLSFVINPMNYSQIIDFAKMAKDMSVDNVRYSIAWFPNWQDVYGFDIRGLMEETEELQDKNFKVFNLTKGRLDNFTPQDKDYNMCGYQHFTTVIGADSVIYPCCTLKYIAEASFGSLKTNRFQEIWEGERRKKWVDDKHLERVCSKHICWMEDKNKFIGYLIEENPNHVNFI